MAEADAPSPTVHLSSTILRGGRGETFCTKRGQFALGQSVPRGHPALGQTVPGGILRGGDNLHYYTGLGSWMVGYGLQGNCLILRVLLNLCHPWFDT